MKSATAARSADTSFNRFERKFVKPKAGRTLIVGSRVYPGRDDRRARFSDALGVDMLEGPGVDVVQDLEKDCSDLGLFDHIECLSVLEHSPKPWLIAENLQNLLVEHGTLFVAVPFVHRIHGYPSDYFRFTPEGMKSLFPDVQWQRVMLASTVLKDGPRIPVIKEDDHPYLARTQVVGFGSL